MRRYAPVLAALLFLSASAASPPTRTDRASFSLIIGRSATGWSAECEIGCTGKWKASFNCADQGKCGARVDAIGIITLANDRRLDPRFSFALDGGVGGITAHHSQGAGWEMLTWGCGKAPCRARVTEEGAQTLPPDR